MATTTSRLQLVIAGDNKGAIRSIQGTEKAIGGLQGELRGLGAGIAGGALAAGSLALGKQAVDAASNLYEQQTKVKTIFGQSADEALRFAESADKSYGQSERQALEAVGVFGNLFTAVGLSQDKSLEMSLTLDQLASDLASFNNVPVDDALTALRSGLVGEQEPLRRFGVNLNEATLKARAMHLGLHEGTGVLSASAKAQAAYSLILEQTTTAQGDFARTSGGLANQQRIASAEWENAKATLGENLLPVMKEVFGVLNVGLDLFERIPGPIRTGAVALTGLALAVGFLGPAFQTTAGYLGALTGTSASAAAATGTLATAETLAAQAAAAEAAATSALVTALTAGGAAEAEFAAAATARTAASSAATAASEAQAAATTRSTGSIAALGAVAPLAAGGLGVLALALAQAAGESKRAEANVEALRSEIEAGTDPVDAFNERLAKLFSGAAGGFELDVSGDFMRQFLDAAGVNEQELSKALTGSEEDWDRFVAKIREGLGQELPLFAPALNQLEDLRGQGQKAITVQGDLEKSSAALDVETGDLAAATSDAASATEDLRTETQKANDFAQEAIDKQGKLTDARESYTDAAADSARADYELGIAQQEATGNSEEYRDAQEQVSEAVEKVGEAEDSAREAVADLAEARRTATERLREYADAERDAALASQDANLKVKEALNEQRRINADPGSTPLEKERAALAVAQAREDARQAGQDATQAAIDNAAAQRAGIEGDAEVVRAKQAVADANKGVRDAVNGVRDAEAEAAKVIAEAKARVLEAQKASSDAAINEAEAWGELVTQQFGAVAGVKAYRDELAKIAADLDPNSPLAQRLARLIEDINRAITTGTTRPASAQPNGGQTGTIGNTSQIPAGDGTRASGDKGPSITQINNNTFLGTPTSTRRAQDQASERTLDRISRKLR